MKTFKKHNQCTIIIFTKIINDLCGELNNCPPKMSMSKSWACESVTLHRKGKFAGVIELRILRRGDYPALRVLIRDRQEVRVGVVMRRDKWGLKTKEGTVNQGMQVASRLGIIEETDSLLKPLGGAKSCWHLDFSQVKSSSDFQVLEM